MRLLSLCVSALAGLLVIGCSSAVPPKTAGRDPLVLSKSAPVETAERWVTEFLASEPGVASFKQVGPGEYAITTERGDELTFYLDNLVARLASAGADRALVFADYEAHLREALAADRAVEPGLGQLMPIVRHKDYLTGVQELAGADEGPWHRPLAGDAVLMLAFDSPTSIQVAPRGALLDRGLDEDAAFALATENLRRFARDLDWEREGGLRAAVLDGNYESSVLLLDDAIAALEADLGGPVAVAVPLRDLLVAARADRAEDVKILRLLIANAASDPYAVSDQLLVRREGRWEVLP